MTESKYRLMRCLSQISQTFCIAHSVAAVMLALIVDYVKVLVSMAYCLVVAIALGVAHCLLDEKIEEELGYEEYE